MLGSPSQNVEAGFSLGGPAIDKDGRVMHFYHIIINKSGVRILWLFVIIIDFDYLIYSSCITS